MKKTKKKNNTSKNKTKAKKDPTKIRPAADGIALAEKQAFESTANLTRDQDQ